MIELLAVFIAFMVLTVEYYIRKKSEAEAVCNVWVQEKQASDWICVDRLQ